MANPALGFPNFIDGTFYPPYFGNGSWTTQLPLTNLANKFLFRTARTTGVTTANTTFDIYTTVKRNVQVIGVPWTNGTMSATLRFRGSNTPAWASCTVGAIASPGATSISITAGAAGATIAAGEIFVIAGQTTQYRATSAVTLTASATGSINITPALVGGITAGLAITCRSGSYTTPNTICDTGIRDLYPIIYPWGSLPYGHPSWFTGRMTAEDAARVKMPWVYCFTAPQSCQYWRCNISDTTNPAGYFELCRLYMCPGWVVSIGAIEGASPIVETDSQAQRSVFGGLIVERREPRRAHTLAFDYLPTDEALVQGFDMIQSAGIDQQGFFIFNYDDTAHLHRRSFAFTFKQPGRLEYLATTAVDRMRASFDIVEVTN